MDLLISAPDAENAQFAFILSGTAYVFRTAIPGDPIHPTQCIPGSLTETKPDASLQFQGRDKAVAPSRWY